MMIENIHSASREHIVKLIQLAAKELLQLKIGNIIYYNEMIPTLKPSVMSTFSGC